MEQERNQKQRVAVQKDLFIIRAINTAVTKILENPYEGTGTLSADPENKKVTFNHVGYTNKEKNISVTLNGFYQNTTMGDLSISITNLCEGTTINGEAHTHVYNNITDTKKGITVLSENYIDGYLLVRE